jgi:hypothetical protein
MRFTVFRLLRNSPVMIGDVCGRNNNVSPSPFLEAVYFQIIMIIRKAGSSNIALGTISVVQQM